MSEILIGRERASGQAPMNSEPELLWTVIAWTGMAIAVVGWFDLALLWLPLPNSRGPEWEFGAITAHLNGMPLGTLGIALLAAGAIGRGWRRTTRLVGIICVLVALSVWAMCVIYLLDAPLAVRAVAPQVKPHLIKAMLKAGVFAGTYAVLYTWLALFLWKKTGIPPD